MKSVVLAIQFLTRLPTPQVQATERDFARSMRWFPAVGLIVGALVAGAAGLGVTGALHLDGLADLADGCGAAHKDRARLLAVMADPHVGSFGVVAIVLQLLAKLVLVHAVIAAGGVFPALILLPFAARIGPLVWTLWLPPLHAGLGARFLEHVRVSHIVGWSVVLAAGAMVVPAILLAVPLIALWGVWLRRTLGGVSGDCHGAGIELVETGLLLAVLALRHL